MNEEYISLVQCTDSGAPLLNMRIMQAAYPAPAPIRSEPVSTQKEPERRITLADFNTSVNADDSLIKRTAYQMISEVKRLDSENAERYTVYYEEYSNQECSVTISAQELTTELIKTFSFSVSTYTDPIFGSLAKVYIGGLFINKKYNNVGSALLDIAKSAVRSLANLNACKLGVVELYSVETAVLFYIKNGFIVKDLFWQNDPQNKVYSTQRMIEFAMKEDNVDIMKRYAKVNSENFLDFVKYLLEKTKYGRYFKAYFEALENPDEIEKSIMQSRFISSIFTTNMIYPYVRDTTKPRVNLKPLTM